MDYVQPAMRVTHESFKIKSDFFPTKDCIIYVMEFCFDTTLLYLDIVLVIVMLTCTCCCVIIYFFLAIYRHCIIIWNNIKVTKAYVIAIDNYYKITLNKI